MASTYTTNLQIQMPGVNDASSFNLWGGFLNTDMQMVDDAVSGVYSLVVAGVTTVLTQAAGLASQNGNQAHYNVSGAPGATATVLLPQSKSRMFSVTNNLTGGFSLVLGSDNGAGAPAGTTVTVANGSTAILYTDGTNAATRVSAPTGYLLAANNLSDVANVTTARSNLGLVIGTSGATVGLLNTNNTYAGNNTHSGNNTFSGTNAFTNTTTFSKQVNGPGAALTDAATISWDVSIAQSATVTLGGNRTLANPTNVVAYGTYIIAVKQDGTGSRTLAYGTNYKWPGGTPPVLSTAAGALDILTFWSPDGVLMCGVAQKAFS